MSSNFRDSLSYVLGSEKVSADLDSMRFADEDRRKKERGLVDTFCFGTGGKYNCTNVWVKREKIIKDIQELLASKETIITVYSYERELYLKPRQGAKKTKLDLNRIGEATYEDGVIESVKSF